VAIGACQTWPAGSRLDPVANDPGCVKTKAINRDRTSHWFKTISCADLGSAFNFEIEIKNIIFGALRTFEFSHSLDPLRKSALVRRRALCSYRNGFILA
jgi:hypothetical protein